MMEPSQPPQNPDDQPTRVGKFPDMETPDQQQAPLTEVESADGPPMTSREQGIEPIQKVIGRHALKTILGRGGMGVVYLARHLDLNRDVALKLIPSGLGADPTEVARFVAEAETVAALNHPNIVQIYDVGRDGDYSFLTMECINGGTLFQLIQKQRLPLITAVQLVRTLTMAIHFAHQRGIIHRDLKPGNVLLQYVDGIPTDSESVVWLPGKQESDPARAALLKLADFGLAKRLDKPLHLTQDGQAVGTPNYMAPEQALGQTENVSVRTDVYALGAILYELVTGRPPFVGNSTIEILKAVCFEDPVPPSQLRTDCPKDLEEIILRCLAKNPTDRYFDALALASALGRYLDAREDRTRLLKPVSLSPRRKVPWPIFGLILLSLVALGWLAREIWRDGSVKEPNSTAIEFAEKQNASQRTAVLEAVEKLNRTYPAGYPDDEEYESGMETLREEIRTARANPNLAIPVETLMEMERAWAGKKLMEVQSTTVPGCTTVAMHPQNKLVAIGAGKEVKFWRKRPGEQTFSSIESNGTIQALCWSTNGEQLAIASTTGVLEIYLGETRRKLKTSPTWPGKGVPRHLRWLSDTQWVLEEQNGRPWLYDTVANRWDAPPGVTDELMKDTRVIRWHPSVFVRIGADYKYYKHIGSNKPIQWVPDFSWAGGIAVYDTLFVTRDGTVTVYVPPFGIRKTTFAADIEITSFYAPFCAAHNVVHSRNEMVTSSRNLGEICLFDSTIGNVLTLPLNRIVDRDYAALSDDGFHLLFVDSVGKITWYERQPAIYPVVDFSIREVHQPVLDLQLSKDGLTLYSLHAGGIAVRNATTGKVERQIAIVDGAPQVVRELPEKPAQPCVAFQVCPSNGDDPESLLVGCADANLYLINAQTGRNRKKHELSPQGAKISLIDYSTSTLGTLVLAEDAHTTGFAEYWSGPFGTHSSVKLPHHCRFVDGRILRNRSIAILLDEKGFIFLWKPGSPAKKIAHRENLPHLGWVKSLAPLIEQWERNGLDKVLPELSVERLDLPEKSEIIHNHPLWVKKNISSFEDTEKSIQLWSREHNLPLAPAISFPSDVTSILVDGERFWTATSLGEIRLWHHRIRK
ncbi:MAG: WD40 repeat domain-containing serine/threonine protein kinase [Zavarzinella sp.]